jgi:hypothetical protein
MPTVPTIINGGSIGGGGGGGSSRSATAAAASVSTAMSTPGLYPFGEFADNPGQARILAERQGAAPVTINVTGGVSTSAEIGQSVYNALLQYKQVYGPLTAIAE